MNLYGRISELRLNAEYRDGKTIPADVYFTAPFKLLPPFYTDNGVMQEILLYVSAGVMEDDRQKIEINAYSSSKLEITSQAYEKLHKMNKGFALRECRISIDSNSSVTYNPLPCIPFAGSAFKNRMTVDLKDETSCFVYSELLTCGRAAMGEMFKYRFYDSIIEIRQGGKLAYRDNTFFAPSKQELSDFGLYEGYTHLGNLIVCNRNISDKIKNDISEVMKQNNAEGGMSQTDSGYTCVKILGWSSESVNQIMRFLESELEGQG